MNVCKTHLQFDFIYHQLVCSAKIRYVHVELLLDTFFYSLHAFICYISFDLFFLLFGLSTQRKKGVPRKYSICICSVDKHERQTCNQMKKKKSKINLQCTQRRMVDRILRTFLATIYRVACLRR